MTAETGYTIDGDVYELPSLDSFTTDDAQVFYDYCGFALEQLLVGDDEARWLHPGIHRTLMHVAYQRAHPDVKPAKVRALIGATNYVDAMATLYADDQDAIREDDAVPPASTSEPEQSSPRGSLVNGNSPKPLTPTLGIGSRSGSDELVDQPEATTALRSVTSST